MLDRLIDMIILVWNHVKPIVFINDFSMGVLLRGGKYKKTLDPGPHFKIPFLDEIFTHYAKEDTILTPSQKLTTKDGKTVTVSGILLYYIEDIKTFLLEINNGEQALSDVAMGFISDAITGNDFTDCYNENNTKQISKDVRRAAKKWGMYLVYFKLADNSLSRTFNIFKESTPHL